LRKVLRQELRIQKVKAAVNQARDKVHERHFAGIALAREHAFSEECSAEPHPVQAANEAALPPAFDRVRMILNMQLGIQ
jgi:hypothetical protein